MNFDRLGTLYFDLFFKIEHELDFYLMGTSFSRVDYITLLCCLHFGFGFIVD